MKAKNQRASRAGVSSTPGMSGWSLRRKLALAVAIPMLLAAALCGLTVAADLDESEAAATSANQVNVLRQAFDHMTAAQAAMAVAGSSTIENPGVLVEALADLEQAVEDLTVARGTGRLTSAQRTELGDILAQSRALRASADGLDETDWASRVRALQSATTSLIDTTAAELAIPEPRLGLLTHVLDGRFALAAQQTLAQPGKRRSEQLFSALGAESAVIDRLAAVLSASDPAITELRTANRARMLQVRTDGGQIVQPEAYDAYDLVASRLMVDIDQDLADAAAYARGRAVFSVALTAFSLLAAWALAALVARTLINPIRRVREGARVVAHEELPWAVALLRAGEQARPITPIAVDTHEEVGQLARAVDDLHQQAVTLAANEAGLRRTVGETFLALSRRNAALINQELVLIESLEDTEQNPHRLERLFELDHMTSRLRRNADSLLVLADSPLRSTGLERVTVSDSLLAATAGVREYKRVRVQSGTDSVLASDAAGDLIHLLTELVDNALDYSSSTTTVRLTAETRHDGVIISVSDSGLGIPDEALARFNKNFAVDAQATPKTTRHMGLFLVSKLAKRHRIVVSMEHNPTQGITATVFVPTSALQEVSVEAEHTFLTPPPAPPAPRIATEQALASARRTLADRPNASPALAELVSRLVSEQADPLTSPVAPVVNGERSPMFTAVIDEMLDELEQSKG